MEELKESTTQSLEKEEQKSRFRKSFIIGILTGVLLTILVSGIVVTGTVLLRMRSAGSDPAGETQEMASEKTLQKMKLIHDVIQSKYALDPVSEEEMTNGVYRGIIESLGDQYSQYFTADEMKEKETRMEGVYYGVGCYVGMDGETGFARLGEIFENSPALEVGLKEGDLIVKVDDTYVKGWDLTDVVALIKGEEGTRVHLTIMREGENNFLEFDVERREVPTQTVDYEMLDGEIAYIHIKEFTQITIEQFDKAYDQAKADGQKGVILDLRDNLGGNLTACVEIARRLLPEGIIVYTEDKSGERVDYTCDGKNEIQAPMVVLVNGNSASASEILAGAIKDYGVGKLLGTTTFGKGIVQSIYPFTDGSAVKLTSSKYFTPKGNNIHGIGIAPDETLEMDYEKYYTEGVDNQLERAKILIGEMLK